MRDNYPPLRTVLRQLLLGWLKYLTPRRILIVVATSPIWLTLTLAAAFTAIDAWNKHLSCDVARRVLHWPAVAEECRQVVETGVQMPCPFRDKYGSPLPRDACTHNGVTYVVAMDPDEYMPYPCYIEGFPRYCVDFEGGVVGTYHLQRHPTDKSLKADRLVRREAMSGTIIRSAERMNPIPAILEIPVELWEDYQIGVEAYARAEAKKPIKIKPGDTETLQAVIDQFVAERKHEDAATVAAGMKAQEASH